MAKANYGGASQRKIFNLMLQPFVQLRIGFLNVGTSLAFVVILGSYIYVSALDFCEVVINLTGADEEIHNLLSSYLGSIGMTAAMGCLSFVTINLLLSLHQTHKLVGPTVAFRRHLQALKAGDFSTRTRLRKGDAFPEVAAELNELSELLAQAAALRAEAAEVAAVAPLAHPA